jgi:hypothetical protein
MRRASCCVQEASGGADQPDQQLDCVLVSESLSAHERLPGGQIQTVRDCRNERVSAPAALVPASRKDVSHPSPPREVRRVQRRKGRHVREVSDDDRECLADCAVVGVQLGERRSEPPLGIGDPRPRSVIRRGKALPSVGDAGSQELVFMWEVPVDGQPLDSCLLGDCADRRPCRADGHVEVYRRLDDSSSGRRACFCPLCLVIGTLHVTAVLHQYLTGLGR